MLDLLLRYFGYARVPPEAVELIVQARLMWEREPRNPRIGTALRTLETFIRSARA